MAELKRIYEPSIYDKASFCSRLFFCWLNPLLRLGSKKELEISDLYPVPIGDRSEYLGNKLDRKWKKEVTKRKPSLTRALIRTFGLKFALLGIFCFVEECGLHMAQPLLLGQLIRYFHPDTTMDMSTALWYATGVVMCSCIYPFTHHAYFFGVNHLGMKMRIACCNLIYKKVLKLSKSALKNTTAGQMVNLLSNDVGRFDQGVILLHYMWIGPLQSILAGFILWNELQMATFVGMSIVFLLIPLQIYLGRIFGKFRLQTARLGDERIRITNEVVSGMRIIRMYAWEKVFIQLVETARRNEARVLMKTAMVRAINMAIYATSTKLIIFLTFATYVLMGNSLSAEKVFVTVALYNNLRLVMTLYFPFAASQGAETLVSIKRLKKFLLLDEKSGEPSTSKSQVRLRKDTGVSMDSVTASWERDDEEPTLKNISVDIKPKQLFAVIGPVGAGKTSFLMALLREIPIKRGQLDIKGTLAYSSQEPWIFQATVKQNIVMGNAFYKKRYKDVLSVCALDDDIKRLPYGDLTLVGEKGASLSGGQKARINLARALYVNAEIYLLDDPFSAVDTEVAKHLFDHGICKYLKNAVCILVTHHWEYLRNADQIMILRDGECIGLGTYDNLVALKFDLQEMTQADVSDARRTATAVSERSLLASASNIPSGFLLDEKMLTYQQLPDEIKSTGGVGFNMYWQYFSAGGSVFLNFLLVVTTIIAQVLYNGCDYWLSYWTNSIQKRSSTSRNIGEDEDEKRKLYVYTSIIVALFVFSLVRCMLFCYMCMRSSINLHNRMFHAIIRTPIIFFDLNPVGRILNRFSRDIGVLDELLPMCLDDSTDIAMKVIGIVVLVILSNYWIIFPTMILIVAFWLLRNHYLKTSRALKRLDGITRSPVFSHLSSTLQGLSTVRAFHVQARFQKEFEEYQDINSSAWFLFICTARWLAIYLDWLTNAFVAITTYSLVLTKNGGVMGGDAGLAITSALSVSGIFQWGVRQSAEVESQMISVERVIEYSKLEPEAPLEGPPEKRPPPDWPQAGVIIFQNVSLQYQDEKPILKNLSFVVNASEKIGIVGRTGAGKSSLIASLFRLTEPKGIILIDRVNILQIGLHEIRKKISIIPQEPVLFQNTMRFNLDPFLEHDDDALWSALRNVKLHSYVKELPQGLDTEMSEGGSNMSNGQRQLVCLARAILQRNKILVMDEATSNVDHETDLLIQMTIREKFASCTVLTIAHRLNTIIDSDRVMVLHEGQIVEFGEPYVLLENKGSYFDGLVTMTGKATASQLKAVASKVYKKKRSDLK